MDLITFFTPKKKSRLELIDQEANNIVDNLMLSGFDFDEIATIISYVKQEAILRIESRNRELIERSEVAELAISVLKNNV